MTQNLCTVMKYNTQLNQIAQLFKHCKIISLKKTYAMCVLALNIEHLNSITEKKCKFCFFIYMF